MKSVASAPFARPLAAALLALTSLAAGLAGCSRASARTVTFGAAGPWTEEYGAMNRRGIELALEALNARPDGRRIEIVFRDDGGDGVRATEIAREFLGTPSIAAVIGHVNSGAMFSAARIYDAGLPAVATTASSPSLTGISRWTFRVISSDSVNGQDIARFLTRMGRRRAAILYENNAYGRGLSNAFRRNFEGEIVTSDPIAEGADQNFEPFITYFQRRRPDVVFVAGTGASGQAFLREARKQGLTATLVGGDGWTVLAADTALAEGVLVGAPFSAEDQRPAAKQFVEAFERRFHMTPDGNAALAYDATMLLARAADAVGPDRARIREYLARLDDARAFAGATGSIRFQADGDPVGKGIVMTRIRRGALVVEADQ